MISLGHHGYYPNSRKISPASFFVVVEDLIRSLTFKILILTSVAVVFFAPPTKSQVLSFLLHAEDAGTVV